MTFALMTQALEFIQRSTQLPGVGWTLLTAMVGITGFMIIVWVQHWPFRILMLPSLVLAPLLANNAMTELGLHMTSDQTVNQAIGFGIGIFAATVVICSATWSYYEAKTG